MESTMPEAQGKTPAFVAASFTKTIFDLYPNISTCVFILLTMSLTPATAVSEFKANLTHHQQCPSDIKNDSVVQ